MSMWLDEDELVELTGYKQRPKQRAALLAIGVRFRVRPADNFLLVERAQFTEGLTKKSARREPNWNSAQRN